jgi:hypothetical protein
MSLGIEEFKEELSAAIDAVPPGMPDPSRRSTRASSDTAIH